MSSVNNSPEVGEVTVSGHMLPDDVQRALEYQYARRHIDSAIELEILDNQVMVDKIAESVTLLSQWITIHTADPNTDKAKRLIQLNDIDLQTFITNLYIGTAFCQAAELFTSVTSMMANRLHFDNKVDSIKTIAEVLSVLTHTQVLTVFKIDKRGSLMLQSNIPLSSRLMKYIDQCGYLPPMVCEPNKVEYNYQSAHLSFNESLILGDNHHEDPCSLDVVNTQNAIALSLDIEFINSVLEEPKTEPETPEKVAAWVQFRDESHEMYHLIADQTDDQRPMYITNRPDKRGRLYAQGYHINPMGSAFKKASINFAKTETVEVPEEYRL